MTTGAQKYKLTWEVGSGYLNQDAAERIENTMSINRDFSNSAGQVFHINDWDIDADKCEAVVDLESSAPLVDRETALIPVP